MLGIPNGWYTGKNNYPDECLTIKCFIYVDGSIHFGIIGNVSKLSAIVVNALFPYIFSINIYAASLHFVNISNELSSDIITTPI